MRQNINQRDQQDDLSQNCQEQRGLGVAQSDEGLLAGDLHAEDTGGRHVDSQRPGGVRHQLRGAAEKQGEQPGEELHQGPESHGIGHAGYQQAAEGVPYPLGVPGAVVVADDRLGALRQALEGHHGQLHDADEHCHGAHGDVAAVFQQGGIEAHGDQALRGLHDEGSQAQGQAGEKYRRHGLQVFTAQPPFRPGTGEEPQYPHGGHGLGEDGGQSRAPDAQPQDEDEDGVQKGIQDRTDQHRFHADGGEALGGDIGVHAQGHLYKNSTQRIDAEIVQGVADGVFAGTEGQQQRFRKKLEYRRQDH